MDRRPAVGILQLFSKDLSEVLSPIECILIEDVP